MSQLLALAILALTVGLALTRPRIGRVEIRPQHAAVIGALLTLGTRLLSPSEAWVILQFLSMPVLTLVSLMVITLIAEHVGFFRLLAWTVARKADGSGKRLFAYLFFTGTLTGALFTNDAAVLIFTPMVYLLIERIATDDWTIENRTPFYFAVLYVANVVGLLVISNPINIVVASYFDIRFLDYAAWMILPGIVSILVTFAGIRWFFRHDIPERFTIPDDVDAPHEATTMLKPIAVPAVIVLVLTLAGMFSEGLTGIPTAYVAAGGAVLLALVYRFRAKQPLTPIISQIGWDVVIFVVGIFLVAAGLRNVGLTDWFGTVITDSAAVGQHASTFATGFTAAASSAVLNNHPVAGMMAMALGDTDLTGLDLKMKVFATLIGGDLGPKMLPIGSLAALLWFRILRDRGVNISFGLYIRIGIPVTLVAVGLSLATLVLEYELVTNVFGH